MAAKYKPCLVFTTAADQAEASRIGEALLVHGANGMRTIIGDYARKNTTKFWLNSILLLATGFRARSIRIRFAG